MSWRARIFIFLILSLIAAGVIALVQYSDQMALLSPQGPVAWEQRRLLLFASAISAIAILPIFTAAFVIVWKYRSTAPRAASVVEPSNKLRTTGLVAWGAFLVVCISILATVAWQSTHDLEASKEMAGDHPEMTVQVVALQWKWIFIYPEQELATINSLVIPEDTKVTFELAADGPMASFWIPQLGGQKYAMEGMINKLALMANQPGEYAGHNVELTGAGYAGMSFTTRALSASDFDDWVLQSKASSGYLDLQEYKQLLVPSQSVTPRVYSLVDPNLYNDIVMQFMAGNSRITPVGAESAEAEAHH